MENINSIIYHAAIYLRLSREDGDVAEGSRLVSNSISNQKALIMDFLKPHTEIEVHSVYADDGYSGVNFERPDFQRMLEDIRKGTVNCVIVKDLSRFGRNYIEAGRYIEKIFPMLGVRFIAITDNYDSIGSMSILWTKKVERLCCFFKFLILLLLWCYVTNRTVYSFSVIPALYVFKNCSAGFL